MPEPFDSLAEFIPQLSQIMTAQVLHLDSFQIVPDTLIGIQVRRIAGQQFQLYAFGGAVTQEVLDGLRAVGRQLVPDDQEFAGDMVQQVLQKADDIVTVKGFILLHGVQLSLWGNRADHRQMFPVRIA